MSALHVPVFEFLEKDFSIQSKFKNCDFIFLFLAGVTPHQDLESRVRFATPDTQRKHYTGTARTANPAVTRLSFDDYHLTWSGIATSKPTLETPNPCKQRE